MPEDIEKALSNLHVVVIGDVMLDRYCWGNVDRISPEAPVPVVSLYREECRLGGAANVALNCKALGASVSMASIIGQDKAGDQILLLLKAQQISHELVIQSTLRPTTTKTRILSRHQQLMRLDEETNRPLDTNEEHPFIDSVLRFLQIQKPDIVIFEDYNKGVLKENVIDRILTHCRALRILTAVDPKKTNFFSYRNVDLFKPNLKEVREGLGISLTPVDENSLNAAHDQLKAQLNHRISLITLSERGVFVRTEDSGKILPSHERRIADVSGAGDTVIAVAAMILACTGDVRKMAAYANLAGGLVCEEVGVVPINKNRLLREIKKLEQIDNKS